ncbi:hypothetical protein NW762_004907 [Fusarium torreyae]|uniref:Uncharacterized protein n=1 Tax=Fusarium torreyae TaxID=1237075 RepID=A0A9W8S7F8_9HYPO|nr:hypothetical protein NW762_004907 [Fusarium torreyae]
MTSDTKSRGRIARLILTDSTTTDDSLDETRSAPSIPRRDHSSDHSSSSKFVEAMNNPDWRRRRDACSTDESTTTTTSGTDCFSSRTRESSHTSAEQDLHTSRVRGSNTSSWDYINSANHWRSSIDYSEAETRDKVAKSAEEVCGIMESMQITDAQVLEEDVHGLCTLLNRMNLMNFGFKDRPVSVIQLTPFPGSDDDLRFNGKVGMGDLRTLPVARIQRVCRRLQRPQREPDNLLPTTNQSDPTHPSSYLNRKEKGKGKITGKSQEETIERARDAVLKDPAVANIGHAHTETKIPILPPHKTKKNAELENRHAAFQRVLQKLQEGAGRRDKTTKGESENGPYHRHGLRGRPKPIQQRNQEEEKRKLNCNSSDSRIGSSSFCTSGLRSKESSQYSGIYIDAETLSTGFNPRAREFLSFKGSFIGKSENHDTASLSNDLLIENVNMDQSTKEANTATIKPVETPSTNLNHSLPIMQPDDHHVPNMGNMSDKEATSSTGENSSTGDISDAKNITGTGYFPGRGNASGSRYFPGMGNASGPGLGPTLTINPNPSQAANGYIPNTMVPLDFTAPFSGYQPPAYSVPGCQTSAISGYQHNVPTVSPTVPHSGYQLNLPTGNSMLQQSAVQPNPYWMNATYLQMPYIPMAPQMGVGGWRPARPPPVPKPTVPNAVQQQDYEQYIEQCKALDPEFAMKCKMRQRNRVQRQLMLNNKPPSQGPPGDGQAT